MVLLLMQMVIHQCRKESGDYRINCYHKKMDRQQYTKQLNRFKIMNRKTVKISFVSVIVIIAGVVYFTMSEYRRKHKDIADIPESFSLNSNEIINSFSTNEKSAYKMYLDKVMSVTGTVNQFTGLLVGHVPSYLVMIHPCHQ